MQLILALAVLAALVIAEDCPRQPVTGAWCRLLLALAGLLLVGLFAFVSSRSIARGIRREFDRRGQWLRRFRRLRQIHALLWLLVAGGILYGLGWGQLVRFNWRLDHLFLVDRVLILLPVVLPLVVSWAAFYEVDRALRLALIEGEAEEWHVAGRGRYVLMQARHFLALLLLPLLLVLAVQDAAERLAPGVLQGTTGLAIYALPLLLLLVFFPLILRYVWQTRPLAPAALRERLEAAARRVGFRCREILVWNTSGMMINAAVAGFLPPFRYVFLSDGLLSHLGDEEIAAVFAPRDGTRAPPAPSFENRDHRLALERLAAVCAVLSLDRRAVGPLVYHRWARPTDGDRPGESGRGGRLRGTGLRGRFPASGIPGGPVRLPGLGGREKSALDRGHGLGPGTTGLFQRDRPPLDGLATCEHRPPRGVPFAPLPTRSSSGASIAACGCWAA